jgi:hypothetical protein
VEAVEEAVVEADLVVMEADEVDAEEEAEVDAEEEAEVEADAETEAGAEAEAEVEADEVDAEAADEAVDDAVDEADLDELFKLSVIESDESDDDEPLTAAMIALPNIRK